MSRPEGFWGLLWKHRAEVFKEPEFIWSAVLGITGGFLAASHLEEVARHDAAGAFLVVVAALVAVVFGAMAILVAVASTDLLALVEDTLKGGVMELLWPFVVGTGLQVASLLATGTYLIVGPELVVVAEQILFGVALFLALFSVLDLVALARFVSRVTRIRAEQAALEREGVATVPRRRNGGAR